MNVDARHAVTGAFVVLLAGLLVVGVIWLGAGWNRETYVVYRAVFAESVAGLSEKAPVTYRGVEVGAVRRIRIDPRASNKVVVEMDVDPDLTIYEDTVAQLRPQGITGMLFVELSGGTPDSPKRIAESGTPEIPTRPSLLHQVDATGGDILQNVQRLTASVAAIADRVDQAFQGDSGGAAPLLAQLQETNRNLNRFLSEDNARSFSESLASVQRMTAFLESQEADVAMIIADARVSSTNLRQASESVKPVFDQLDQLNRQLATVMDRLGETMAEAGDGVTRTMAGTQRFMQQVSSETVPALQRLLQDLGQLSRSLKRVGEDVEQQPNVLFFGKDKAPAGPGEAP